MEGTQRRRMTSTGGTAVRRVGFAVVGVAILLGGCVEDGLMDMARFQLKPDEIIIDRRPDTDYEKLFPYYVELCAASQFRSKLTGEGGGPAGHAILYINPASARFNSTAHRSRSHRNRRARFSRLRGAGDSVHCRSSG